MNSQIARILRPARTSDGHRCRLSALTPACDDLAARFSGFRRYYGIGELAQKACVDTFYWTALMTTLCPPAAWLLKKAVSKGGEVLYWPWADVSSPAHTGGKAAVTSRNVPWASRLQKIDQQLGRFRHLDLALPDNFPCLEALAVERLVRAVVGAQRRARHRYPAEKASRP